MTGTPPLLPLRFLGIGTLYRQSGVSHRFRCQFFLALDRAPETEVLPALRHGAYRESPARQRQVRHGVTAVPAWREVHPSCDASGSFGSVNP